MTSAQYVRQRRERLIAAGLCIDCGSRPRLTTAQRCRLCNEKQLERQRMRKVGTAVGRDDGGPTLREIADEVGVSPARVQQIIAKALYKLRRECRRRGIDASWITGKPNTMMGRVEDDQSYGDGSRRTPQRSAQR